MSKYPHKSEKQMVIGGLIQTSLTMAMAMTVTSFYKIKSMGNLLWYYSHVQN